MNHVGMRILSVLILAGSVFLAACGGGGGDGAAAVAPNPGGASILAWDPPQTYDDTTPLDPLTDLDYYEFYVRADENFSDNDLPVAQVAAVSDIVSPDGTVYVPALTTEFDLENLRPFMPADNDCYLSIRAVGMDGAKSEFSQPILWRLIS